MSGQSQEKKIEIVGLISYGPENIDDFLPELESEEKDEKDSG